MVWRPADGNETSAAYLVAMNAHCPSILCLSRQNLPQLENSTIVHAAKGGYVVHETRQNEKADITLVSTGSEVGIAIEAVKILEKEGKHARVVSLPCFEVFDMQSREYRLSVLPDGAPVMSVEAMSVRYNPFSLLALCWLPFLIWCWHEYRHRAGRSTHMNNMVSTLSEPVARSRKYTRSTVLLGLISPKCRDRL